MHLDDAIRAACEPFAHRIETNIRITCPECSHRRKGRNKREPVLSVLIKEDRFVYDCHHCDISGCVPFHTTPHHTTPHHDPLPPQDIKRAEAAALDDEPLAYLETTRHISRSVLQQFGVFSTEKYFPKLDREVTAIGFPYFEGDQIYATKFRAVEAKAHTQSGGGAHTFFGEQRINGETTLCVCEGEIDALSCTCAFEETGQEISAVSVPNGAPSKLSDRRVDPSEDKKFNYVWEARELFGRMEKIVLATDGDAQGDALAEELARRIGKAKCWLVRWPPDCKDANDVLVKHGAEALSQAITDAVPYPLSGLNTADHYSTEVDDLYRKGIVGGESTGFPSLDDLITVKTGHVSVVTGIPSSGKSCFLDAVMVNLARSRSWKFAICSFENDPATHITQLIEKFTGKPFFDGPTPRLNEQALREAKDFIADHFVFIDYNEGEKATLASILERAGAAVQRMGVRGLIIDPYSYIALPNKDKSETQQISDMLTDVRMFAKLHDIHVWFVAHPAKMRREEGNVPVPKGYDLSGSAHWYNFADTGITVARFDDTKEERERVKIICWKQRYRWLGSQGERVLDFDLPSGCYYEEKNEVSEWVKEESWWKDL